MENKRDLLYYRKDSSWYYDQKFTKVQTCEVHNGPWN